MPFWKVARETDRFVQQMKALAGLFWEPVVQWQYDRSRRERLVFSGSSELPGTKVAIYLVFQPSGVLVSTLETCRSLARRGYSVLVVSNGVVSSKDMVRLEAVAWKVMLRPNYGYDFGGYRDGILHLFEIGASPQKLLVMNDSIWYPISSDDDLIARMESSGLDVTGTIVHRKHRKSLLRPRGARVIESYFFVFDHREVVSPAFRAFWMRYRMSSNKYNAVHRGERRITETMRAAGLSADGLFGREEFLAAIATRDNAFLRRTLFYGAYTDDDLQRENEVLLADNSDSADWRQRVLDHVTRTSLKRNFHGAFVFASMSLLDMPFIKKGTGTFLKRSYGTLYTRMRKRYLAAIAAGDLPPPTPEVLVEIAARDGITIASAMPTVAQAP